MKRTLLKISLVAFCLLLVSAGGFAQEKDIKFDNISLEEGLSQSSVRCIVQDSKGFMWFGTLDGLNKFDGYEMKKYRFDEMNPFSISDNYINTLYEDNSQSLWIGTQNAGLCRYNKIKDNFVPLNEDNKFKLSSRNVTAIYQDVNGVYWIGTDKGLNRMDMVNHTIEHFVSNPLDSKSISSNHITCITGDKNGNVWVGSDNGVSLIKPGVEKVFRFRVRENCDDCEDRNHINTLLFDLRGRLWVGTNAGMAMMDSMGRFNFLSQDIPTESTLSSPIITSIVRDRDGILWVGTRSGLNRLDPGTMKISSYFHDPVKRQSLSENHILTLYQDRSGILWVGTELGGINKWNRAAEDLEVFRHNPYDPSSLSSSRVRTIYQDRNGEIWVGTVNGGLNLWNTAKDQFVHYRYNPSDPGSLSNDHVRAVYEDSKGNFWVGTNGGGLNLFDRKTGKFVRYRHSEYNANTIPSDFVWRIIEDRNGKLWLATYGGGLCQFDYQQQKFRSYTRSETDNSSISSNEVTTVFEDHKGILWVGTMQGLNKFDPVTGSFKRFLHNSQKPESIGNDRVYTIFEDSKHNLWIGTKGSLNLLDRKTESFIKYSEKDGLPNDVIMGILEDKGGNLWISTNSGLSKFNHTDNTFRNYDVKDGLQSNEFLVGSYCVADDGEMFFGGINGFNAFYPDRIKDNPNKPLIVITGFQIFNREVDLDTTISEKKVLKLSYKDKVFSFDFVALDYIFPEKNQYAYIMERAGAKGSKWVEHGTRRYVSFNSLPPGEYNFKVKGSNNDGVWNEEGVSLRVIITPPFWKTTWFRVLAILILLGGVATYIKLRERKLRRDKAILEQTVKERTREIERQKLIVEQYNQDITDSINYASKIQSAALPPEDLMNDRLPDHFIFWRPRDIVSGDFYWIGKKENHTVVTVADCTGHGVPGAFMSMLGISSLNEIVSRSEITQAGEILNELRTYIIKSLRQTGEANESKDGMDIALCVVDNEKNLVQFAGANNPLLLVRNNELFVYNPNKMPIGVHDNAHLDFTNNEIEVQSGDALYMFSDGYVDQFGGPKGKKFLIKRLKDMLLAIHELPMKSQGEYIRKEFEEWKEGHEQIDDVLVMGFRIP